MNHLQDSVCEISISNYTGVNRATFNSYFAKLLILVEASSWQNLRSSSLLAEGLSFNFQNLVSVSFARLLSVKKVDSAKS